MRMLAPMLALGLAVSGNAADSTIGEKLFQAKCASCHKKDGKGNPNMAKMFKVDKTALDLTDKDTLDKKDEELTTTTLKGKGKMPKFEGKLKGTEAADIVFYLRSLAISTKTQEQGALSEASKESNVAAASLYAGKCSSCHGKDAKGNPAMARMLKVDSAVLDLVDAKTLVKKDGDIIAIVAQGKGKMSAYKGKLSEAEISDLVRYIRSLAGAATQ